jgi:predicted Kef-type K+ transport protein
MRLFSFGLRYAEKKPLAVSVVALLASLPSVGALISRSFEGFRYDWRVAGLCVFSLAISVLAVVNLIRAENRGYSSTRIGLSVTALFFAFVPEIGLAIALIRDYGRS